MTKKCRVAHDRKQVACSKWYENVRDNYKELLSAYLKRHDKAYKKAFQQYNELTFPKEAPVEWFTQMAQEHIRRHLIQVTPMDLKCVYFPEILFDYRIQRTQLANNELEGLVRHVNNWFKPGVDLSVTFFRGPFEIPEAGVIQARAFSSQHGIPSALQNDLEVLRSSYDTILYQIWWSAFSNVLIKDSSLEPTEHERLRQVLVRAKSFEL